MYVHLVQILNGMSTYVSAFRSLTQNDVRRSEASTGSARFAQCMARDFHVDAVEQLVKQMKWLEDKQHIIEQELSREVLILRSKLMAEAFQYALAKCKRVGTVPDLPTSADRLRMLIMKQQRIWRGATRKIRDALERINTFTNNRVSVELNCDRAVHRTRPQLPLVAMHTEQRYLHSVKKSRYPTDLHWFLHK
jgi:hypothetical protein